MFKEKCRQELQDTEQRRNDLMPEHQKLQRSQNLLRLQDRRKQCQKDASKCDGGMERVSDETAGKRFVFKCWDEESRRLFWHKRIWMKRSEFCKQEKTDEAVAQPNPTDAASILLRWSSSSRLERHKRGCSSSSSRGVQ